MSEKFESTIENREERNLVDKVVQVNRVAKVVKGGRRFSFSVVVVVGNEEGKVGYGLGKAGEVPDAIRKGMDKAKKNMSEFNLKDNRTIHYQVIGKHGSARVLLKPASEGTGLIAGGAVRAVLSAVGVKDMLTKIIGTNNVHNVVKATIDGLNQLEDAKKVALRRGLSVEDILN